MLIILVYNNVAAASMEIFVKLTSTTTESKSPKNKNLSHRPFQLQSNCPEMDEVI